MTDYGKGGGLFTILYGVVVNIPQHNKIINRRIAAFLTLCWFSSTNVSTIGVACRAEDIYGLVEHLDAEGVEVALA